jgi:hypothetical protein
MLGISKLRIPNINSLPVNLIRPTRIIPENRNSLRHILTKNNIIRLAYKKHHISNRRLFIGPGILPLSQASIVAKTASSRLHKSPNFHNSTPRSCGVRFRHSEPVLKAARAAATAASTSFSPAASTVAMRDSS